MKQISIIIPCYNEENYIEACLESVLQQDYPSEKIEIILIDGFSTDNTKEIVKTKFPKVIILNNPDKIVPISLNLGINQAKGDYIIRMDAHAFYPKNYVSELIIHAEKLQADNIGTLIETLPANSSNQAIAIAHAISHPLGVGNSYFRIGTNKIKEVDTVPFGCYKKEVFEKIGFYDEELIRNQDDELNGRLKQNGGKIYLLPHLHIEYFARETFAKTYKMFFQYGLFKPLVNKKLKKPATLRQFVPLAFVLYLFLGFILSIIFGGILSHLYQIGLLLYFSLLFFTSWKIGRDNNLSLKTRLIIPFVFFIVHFGYGYGYICGILNLFRKKNINATVNR